MPENYVLTHLARIRRERILSQRELATKAGLPHQTIMRAERGERVRARTVRLVAEALGVEPSALLGD